MNTDIQQSKDTYCAALARCPDSGSKVRTVDAITEGLRFELSELRRMPAFARDADYLESILDQRAGDVAEELCNVSIGINNTARDLDAEARLIAGLWSSRIWNVGRQIEQLRKA